MTETIIVIPTYNEARHLRMSARVKLEAALRVFEIRWRDSATRPLARPVEAP